MDWKLELVPIPVSDVDYAEKVGFSVDLDVSAHTDHRVTDERSVVQLTPPDSAARSPSGSGSWTLSPAPSGACTWSCRT